MLNFQQEIFSVCGTIASTDQYSTRIFFSAYFMMAIQSFKNTWVKEWLLHIKRILIIFFLMI